MNSYYTKDYYTYFITVWRQNGLMNYYNKDYYTFITVWRQKRGFEVGLLCFIHRPHPTIVFLTTRSCYREGVFVYSLPKALWHVLYE